VLPIKTVNTGRSPEMPYAHSRDWLSSFLSNRSGEARSFALGYPVDGGEALQLTNHLGIDAHPAWSPDGQQIVFATDRWGGLEIAVMRRDVTDVRRLTDSPGLDDYPAWSPDGGRIAFVSNRDGNYEVYVMPATGGEAMNISRAPGIDTFPTWTPDGEGLTFVSNRADGFDLYTISLVPP
jgi:TolB protein